MIVRQPSISKRAPNYTLIFCSLKMGHYNLIQGKNGAVKLMLCPINQNNPNSVKGEKSFELGTYRRNIEKYRRRSLILHCVFHEITLPCHRAEMRQKAGLTGKEVQCTEFQIEEPERKILTRNLREDKRIILK